MYWVFSLFFFFCNVSIWKTGYILLIESGYVPVIHPQTMLKLYRRYATDLRLGREQGKIYILRNSLNTVFHSPTEARKYAVQDNACRDPFHKIDAEGRRVHVTYTRAVDTALPFIANGSMSLNVHENPGRYPVTAWSAYCRLDVRLPCRLCNAYEAVCARQNQYGNVERQRGTRTAF